MPPRGQRLDQRRLVDHPAARDIDEIGRRLHAGERRGVDQVLGLRGQRAGQRHEIGLAATARRARPSGAPRPPRPAPAPDRAAARSRACRRPWRVAPDGRRYRRGRRSAASCRRARPRAATDRRSCRARRASPGCRAPRAGGGSSASISAIACSATARALTPRALARRMPRRANSSRGNWSVPAPIDWMNRSRGARSSRLLFHSPETTSTSASPIRAGKALRVAHLETADAGRQRGKPLVQPIGDRHRQLRGARRGRA